jgi:putative ABC transport system ATP-binding protein
VIKTLNLSREYQVGEEKVHALQQVNLEIPHGDYVSIMGPSGSGKSTLLHLLGCLDRPTAGVYLLSGMDVTNLSEAALSEIRRNQIGFIFQSFHLINRLDAAGNVALPLMFAGAPRGNRQERVVSALNKVGLAHRASHRPMQLSGGERQRAAIARAIVMNPKILLADEPTGNLDGKTGQEILKLMETMNEQGLTLIIVTHDPVIGNRARRRITLRDGQIMNVVTRTS